MKKTLTVNLGGTVYHIDDDAYRLLDNYLSNLKHYFRKQESAEEIINDIEMRIAELFAEKVAAGKQVVTVQDVEEVIARVGKPEDFGITEDDAESNKRTEQSSSASQTYTRTAGPRRLFRDPDSKLLGGVAAGLAAYLGWDITLVRILMIVLVFVPYCPMIILYIVGWIVIPEAHTAAEKLSMRGEAVTIENIGKTVTDGFERVADGVNNYVNSGKPRTFLQKIGDVFVAIAAVFFKILLYELLPAIDWTPIASVTPMMTLLGTIAGVALIGIPLGAFLYTILRQLFHWAPMGTGLKWSLLILWILGAVIMIINLSALGWQLPLYGLHHF